MKKKNCPEFYYCSPLKSELGWWHTDKAERRKGERMENQREPKT